MGCQKGICRSHHSNLNMCSIEVTVHSWVGIDVDLKTLLSTVLPPHGHGYKKEKKKTLPTRLGLVFALAITENN